MCDKKSNKVKCKNCNISLIDVRDDRKNFLCWACAINEVFEIIEAIEDSKERQGYLLDRSDHEDEVNGRDRFRKMMSNYSERVTKFTQGGFDKLRELRSIWEEINHKIEVFDSIREKLEKYAQSKGGDMVDLVAHELKEIGKVFQKQVMTEEFHRDIFGSSKKIQRANKIKEIMDDKLNKILKVSSQFDDIKLCPWQLYP